MFSWMDYLVFSITVVVSVAIGAFYARKNGQGTISEYLVADRRLGIIPVALSMTVSYMSSLSILGISSETHYYGITFTSFGLGMAVGILLAAYCAVPLLHPLQLTSMNEYITQRFNSSTLLLASWVWQVLQQLCYTSVVIYATSAMFEVMVGLPSWIVIMLMSITATLYTVIGGLKAVIWTDVLQTLIILAGLVTIIIRGTILTGGLHQVFAAYDDGYRMTPITDPSLFIRQSIWLLFPVGFLFGYSPCHLSQPGVLRICAIKTMEDARKMVLLSLFFRVVLFCMCCFCGIITFAYYHSRGCDPIESGLINKPSQILPYFVMDVLSFPGLPGLFVACVFSAALSTISSCLNGIASLTWDDLLSKRLQHWPEAKKTFLTKLITFGSGVVSLILSLAVAPVGGTVIQLNRLMSATSSTPVNVVFLAGALIPWVNWKSVLSGSLLSMAWAAWLSIGSMFYKSHQEFLPFAERNCSSEITMINGTQNVAANFSLTHQQDIQSWRTDTNGSQHRYGIETLYLVSPNLIETMLTVLGILISMLLLILPGFNTRNQTNSALHFPCIKGLLGKVNRRKQLRTTSDESTSL